MHRLNTGLTLIKPEGDTVRHLQEVVQMYPSTLVADDRISTALQRIERADREHLESLSELGESVGNLTNVLDDLEALIEGTNGR